MTVRLLEKLVEEVSLSNESKNKLLKDSLDLGDQMIGEISNLNEENRELRKIILECLNLIDISWLDNEKSNKMKEILERIKKYAE